MPVAKEEATRLLLTKSSKCWLQGNGAALLALQGKARGVVVVVVVVVGSIGMG